MAYSKQTWVRGEKVASTKLNHMEDGIAAISANGAIDTANLANASVTNAKLDQEAVDSNNIRTGAIITPLIYDGAVTAEKLGTDVQDNLDNKSDIDGSYESMTVGNAEQLVSSVGITDQTPYNFRTSGGSTEIGDREELNAVVGVSVPWNQLVQNGNFDGTANWTASNANIVTLTASNNILSVASSANGDYRAYQNVEIVPNHCYLVSADIKGTANANVLYAFLGGTGAANYVLFTAPDADWHRYSAIKKSTDGNVKQIRLQNGLANTTNQYKNACIFDLTQMFGSTIADYIYALEQANAGAGVAYFKKLFPKPYYAYNSGELLSVRTNLHKMVGFNAYNPTTGTAKVVGGSQYQITGAYTSLSLDGTTITPDANGKFTPSANGTLTVTGGNSTTTCVHLVWDGERNDEFEPYEAHEYAFDDITLRGILKLDASNNLYADGDRYLPDGTVTRRFGIADLSSLTWTKDSDLNGYHRFYASVNVVKANDYREKIISTIPSAQNYAVFETTEHTMITGYHISGGYLYIISDTIASVSDLNTYLTNNNSEVVYELATPTTETADAYQQTQIVDDFGTEEFVDAAVEAGERDVAIPVGNITFYPQNLRKKIEGLPFDFSTLIARTEKTFKATRAYAVNEFLIINNQLYKTRTSIANGATITVGTNVIATTIGAELTAILNS